MTRPKEIGWFMILQLVSIAAGVWQMITEWDAMVAEAGGDLGSTGLQVVIAITYAITFLLLYFIWQRSNAARWIYIVFAVLGILIGLASIAAAPLEAMTILQSLLSVASVALLLLAPVRNWFEGKTDPDVFS